VLGAVVTGWLGGELVDRLGVLVDGPVGFGAIGEIDDGGDDALGAHASVDEPGESQIDQPLQIPDGRVPPGQGLGAGGDEGEPVDVELVAQIEPGRVLSVEGDHADGAAEARGANGLMQSRHAA
jgi:hypothetical protein